VLQRDAFGIENTAKLTGLSKSQLERWDRNGFFHPSLADPNRRRPNSRTYSTEDVVGLRVIARLRELGVPLRELKNIRKSINLFNDENWANQQFYVVEKSVYLSKGELNGRTGPTVLSLKEVVRELETRIKKLSERTEEQIGKVTRNRFVMSGQPVLAGTRIPTSTIAELVEDGYSHSFILREFPRLKVPDIEAAVRFEKETRHRAAS
jgi:uncharacterized protein (DUF433 family)